MPQKRKTKSEILFERFCEENSIRLRRIPETSVRTPDYEFFPGGTRVVVEVKQVEPNKEDKKYEAAIEAGQHPVGCYTPGQKVRKIIDEAYPQIKAAGVNVPGLIVAYNTVDCRRTVYLDGYDVMTGMYGFETVELAVPSVASKKSKVKRIAFGGKKRVTPSQSRTLSAFAVLYDSEPVAMYLFHNKHATNPLEFDLLRFPSVRQFRMEDLVGSDWKEWTPS